MNEKQIQNQVVKKIRRENSQDKPTRVEKIADLVASFGGSWKFICLFSSFFTGWILFNLYIYSFDTYPFIMLNLVLSCLAVFQAPFILMSQNRLHHIDKKREENDYKINLKTELEVKQIYDKLEVIHNELKARTNRTD